MENNTQISQLTKLHEASKQGRLVVFVGAGVSANSGVPTWGELITALKDDLPKSLSNEKDDLKIAQIYKDSYGYKDYFKKIRDVLKDGRVACNPIHHAILELDPVHIITTNYKISLGALLHFNVPSYMEPTRISFSGYLEDADSGDTIKRVPEVGITQDIKYKKAVEEFQIWGNGYIKCNKGTWCLYEAVADNFPEDLKLKTYFCLTNYAPSEVSNRMMK